MYIYISTIYIILICYNNNKINYKIIKQNNNISWSKLYYEGMDWNSFKLCKENTLHRQLVDTNIFRDRL